MIGKTKNILYILFGFFILIIIVFIFSLFIEISFIISTYSFQFILLLAGIAFFVSICIFTPLAFFQKTMYISSKGFIISSNIIGLLTLIYSFIVVYHLWGLIGVISGLFLGVVGIVPVALLSCIFNGKFTAFFEILLSVAIYFIFLYVSYYIDMKSDKINSQSPNIK
ncbi:MAG TPA: hypothetical protein PLZ38_07425 [Spirochaetota bacterium]|nr:hypothetical protein [Spirochaetota bacterium]